MARYSYFKPGAQQQVKRTDKQHSRVTPATCVHLDNSPANYGGNQTGGMGQDAEANAFERLLRNNLERVNESNERLANEQTKQGQGSTGH
jgi:hypothetical protein